jgi:hypothetical protein
MSLVLNVEILGEYKNLAKATKGAEGSFKKLGDKFSSIGKNIAKVTAGIGIGLGVAVASQIKPAIDAASDLSEGINAVNVSFGDAAEGILELGENAARGLGLSKTELFGIATQFSSFAGTIAGEGGNIVSVVDEISKRGADFASVFNLEVGDALGKFQSGLAGQSEPLRNYGIDLSAATVLAHALETGIFDGVGAMTESEKVQARYSSLMEQTDKVTGDFANTSDGLANQQRILKATLEDTRAEIGEKFMPIMQDIQTLILETVIPAFMEFYEAIIDPAGEAQTQLRFIGDAMDKFAETFGIASNDITSDQVFNWLGDSIISVMRMLTHLSVFTQETFGAIGQMFNATPFLSNPAAYFSDMGAATARFAGAMGKANAAAAAISFAPDVTSGAGNQQRLQNSAPSQRFDQFGKPISQTKAFKGSGSDAGTTINVNINRAKVDAQSLINDINSRLKTQGSTRLLR